MYQLAYLSVAVLLISAVALAKREGGLYCRSCGAEISQLEHSVRITNQDEDVKMDEGELLLHDLKGNNGRLQLITVSETRDTLLGGEINSYPFLFANYNHQLLKCSRCGRHLGWHHTLRHDHKCDSTEYVKAVLPTGRKEDKVKQENHEIRSIDWALESIENLCLKRAQGPVTYEWCHKEIIKLSANSGTETMVLGRYSELENPRDNTATGDVKFGDKLFQYISHVYNDGDSCLPQKDIPSTVKVLLLCCDSYSENEMSIEENENLNFRIEFVRTIQPCDYELYVCVPKLCFVASFEYPESTVKEDENQFHTGEIFQNRCPYRNFYSLIWSHLLSEASKEYNWLRFLKPSL